MRVQVFTAAVGDFPHAAHYVQQLYEGFVRHMGWPVDFHVVTDLPGVRALQVRGQNNLIAHQPHRKVWGWWNLMELYRPDAPWSGKPVIMVGLDTVIRGDMGWAVRDYPTFLQPFSDQHGRKTRFNGTYADGLVYLPDWCHYTDVYDRYVREVSEEETFGRKRGFPMHPWVTEAVRDLYFTTPPQLWQVDVGANLLASWREPSRSIEEPDVPLVIFHGSPRPHEAIDEAPWLEKHFARPALTPGRKECISVRKMEKVNKVAVLANGPSLTEYWSEDLREDYDLVIGVNTAAWIYPVDIWCALDPAVVQMGIEKMDENGIPVPATMATHGSFKHVPEGCERMDMPWYNKKSDHLPKGVCQELGIKSCNFTFPNALYVASLLSGGGQVDVYGMDITPENDVCEKWGDRTGGRWKREFPWTLAAWQPHWRIFGKASPLVREVLAGEKPFMELVKVFDKYVGGQSHRNNQLSKAEQTAKKALREARARKRAQIL